MRFKSYAVAALILLCSAACSQLRTNQKADDVDAAQSEAGANANGVGQASEPPRKDERGGDSEPAFD